MSEDTASHFGLEQEHHRIPTAVMPSTAIVVGVRHDIGCDPCNSRMSMRITTRVAYRPCKRYCATTLPGVHPRSCPAYRGCILPGQSLRERA